MTFRELFKTTIKDGGKVTSPTSDVIPPGGYIKRATEEGVVSLYIYDSDNNVIGTPEAFRLKEVEDWTEVV